MGRPKRNQEPKDSAADVVDKIFAQVDPIVAAGGLLAAGATWYGMPPPLTNMLGIAFNREIQSGIADVLTWSPISASIGVFTGNGIETSWADIITGNYGSVNETDREKLRRKHGMVLCAAFEGMVLMSLVRNESFLNKAMELGGKLGSATIQAAGEAVPF